MFFTKKDKNSGNFSEMLLNVNVARATSVETVLIYRVTA